MLLDPQSSFDATDFVIGRVFPVAGLLLSAAFSLSPLPQLKAAQEKGDLGKFDPMPQAINMASGASWVLYASLAENYFPMVSGAGAYASSYLSVLMARDAADAETRKSLDDVTHKMAYGLAAAAFAAVLLTATGHHTLAMNAAGVLANALILCVYVSPLKNFQSVMATKDASSIFLPWSALQLINNLLWVVYGSYVSDKYVFTSSLVGVVSAVAAMTLKAIYPSQPEHYRPRYAIVKWMPDPDVLLK